MSKNQEQENKKKHESSEESKENLNEKDSLKSKNSIGIIIAHYNEDLDWVDSYLPDNVNIYIFGNYPNDSDLF